MSSCGAAGTGKTPLAIAAGMAKVLNENAYVKLLCARAIMPLGRDIGYLPGDKDQKRTAWMQPIFDNMSCLSSNRLAGESGHPSHGPLSSVEQRSQQLVDWKKASGRSLQVMLPKSFKQESYPILLR